MKRPDIEKILSPSVRSLSGYRAETSSALIKLDANESPFGFGIKKGTLKDIQTNRYPDPDALALKKAFSRSLGVGVENLLLGNGSDEIIYYLMTAFRGPVLYPVPTFSMYGIIAQALGRKKIEVPLDAAFDIDVEKTLVEIRKRRPGLVFLSSPNNPTGRCFSKEGIFRVIKAAEGIVVVDEAYLSFSGRRSMAGLVLRHGNLAVLRTLSKVGLAALRVGVLAADPDVIEAVNRVRLPFNLNSLSQAVALDALKEGKRMNSYVGRIVSERKRLFAGMSKIDGVGPYPSDSNFILFKVSDPEGVFSGLLKRGVLVRNPGGLGCLRVTVGTRKENDFFLKKLKEATG